MGRALYLGVLSKGAMHRVPWIFILIAIAFTVTAQSGSGEILKRADENYRQGFYLQAQEGYIAYLRKNPQSEEVQYQLAKVLMKLDQPEHGRAMLRILIDEKKKVPAKWYLTMGVACQETSSFEEADRYYRLYVENANQKADFRKVQYLIQQNSVGLQFTPGFKTQYVENMGRLVNRISDEYGPVYSPNFDQRIYYTVRQRLDSIRQNRAWSVENAEESMMVSAEIRQGNWKQLGVMDLALAGAEKQVLLDFVEEGQMVLFEKQEFTGEKKTYYHHFGVEDKVIPPAWHHPFYQSEKGDRDLTSINDSAFIFSSARHEGYGGYDLFVTYKRLGGWVLENLGSRINSEYDEITPFLAADGRTLFFSSNSDKSMGGYDVLYSTFDDVLLEWSDPQNAGRPVNSGKDDTGYRLADSGSEAVFSSNRSGGFGGFDLYQVFMDQPVIENYSSRYPAFYYQVKSFQAFMGSAVSEEDAVETKPVETISSIYFDRSPVVISKNVRSTLDQLLHYSSLFPHVGLIMHIFSDRKEMSGFSLFQPYLFLEPIGDYLRKNGLSSDRMTWRIYGGQYPLSKKPKEEGGSSKTEEQERRVEFELTYTKNIPVRFQQLRPDGEPDALEEESPYQEWLDQRKEIYFSIRLLKSDQLLQGDVLRGENDVMMEVSGADQSYTYYVGMFTTMEESRKNLRRFKAKGYKNAEIAAFFEGLLLDADQISVDIIEKYPEIKEYIIYQQ